MSRKRAVWLVAGTVVAVTVVGAYIVLSKWMNSSNEGTVRVGSTSTEPAALPEPVAVKTAYFTTTLPAGFTVKTQAGASLPLHLVANTPSNTNQQFAVTYDRLPAGGVSQVGDYNLRATQTQAYIRYTPPGLPQGAVAFKTASGPAGLTVFWPHGSYYAEISLSTDGIASLEQLESVFSQAVSAWQWL